MIYRFFHHDLNIANCIKCLYYPERWSRDVTTLAVLNSIEIIQPIHKYVNDVLSASVNKIGRNYQREKPLLVEIRNKVFETASYFI